MNTAFVTKAIDLSSSSNDVKAKISKNCIHRCRARRSKLKRESVHCAVSSLRD